MGLMLAVQTGLASGCREEAVVEQEGVCSPFLQASSQTR